MKTIKAPVPLLERLHPRHIVWLMVALAMVTAPHVERMPWWVSLLAAVLIGWRFYITFHSLELPRKWLLLALAISAAAGIYMSYGRIFGRDAGVTLLAVMLGLKLLEMKTLRDAMIMVFLCYFLVITNFLYSQTIPTALYMLVAVWVITATMLGFQFRGAQPSLRSQLSAAGVMLLQATPLMVALFILFPRVQGPIWGMPQDAHAGLTGLSDEMSPGSVSSLTSSDAIAFRVSFRDAIPALNQLYWRGPVLWDFDGYTWTVLRARYPVRSFEALGGRSDYTVTVEPHNRRWLFALDLPLRAPPQSVMTGDFQLLHVTPVTARYRYDMTSFLRYRDNAQPPTYELRRARALPPNSNPRSTELALKMRRAAADERAFIAAVLRMFREQKFYYTTTPPQLGPSPVDQFLFETRAGFCEHYASAFAVLMRAAGIPTRVVTGYQGGELNTVGNYITVRQADAHAWTEVWLDGSGWTRVDPTAAVSPARVESGVAAAVPEGEALPLLLRGEYEWLRRTRMTWDSVANSWNQAVLGYTQDRQRQLMQRAGIEDATWRSMAIVMLVTTALILLVFAGIMLRRLRAIRPDAVTRAYQQFCQRLARRGLARAQHEGPDVFRRRAAGARPDLAAAINKISGLYIQLRYGKNTDSSTREDTLLLKREVKAFRV